ncbi:ATP-binding protein [Roseovarius sp. M141]|uniref:ATP-binding protein n=1 Tax=Roseovarius sp. M141 TaxID=2583806 RepID=UPI0020CE901D|nr:ATP-binding protein [Roseovarius sp. M141]
MTDRREAIERLVAKLEAQFFEREFYPVLEEEFSAMLAKRRMSLESGQRPEGRVLAIIGGSGSGKTTASDRLVAPYLQAAQHSIEDASMSVIQFNSPNKATGKDVAIEAIAALGYPASPTRSEGSLRTLLRSHLTQRGTLVVHIDEAQDLVRFQTQNERERVVKLLKSLMVDKIGCVLISCWSAFVLPEMANIPLWSQ